MSDHAAAPSGSDTYSRITNRIIQDLEKGQLTWRKPWNGENLAAVSRPLRWNNIPYTGVNTLMLWGTCAERGYQSRYWMTYNQAQELGGNVRKGQTGTLVVYANKLSIEEEKDGEIEVRNIPYLKGYSVFNADQIEGLAPVYYAQPTPPQISAEQRITEVERFFAATKAEIIHGGNVAAYAPVQDVIKMPPFESFQDRESYYATLAHEITHWTKHVSRLDRNFGASRFGNESYAKEELVAELGSCFLAADLGLEPELREDHTAYIQYWLQVLKSDKRFNFTAASYAQKAADYIHGLVRAPVHE